MIPIHDMSTPLLQHNPLPLPIVPNILTAAYATTPSVSQPPLQLPFKELQRQRVIDNDEIKKRSVISA